MNGTRGRGADGAAVPDVGDPLTDEGARREIRQALNQTLFVTAGAGSGKTRELVERVVQTVLDPSGPVPIRQVAVLTFTEKVGAELRARLRAAFEQRLAANSGADGGLIEAALDDLDGSAIGTLHSFAQRILTEHPIEAGLPPLVEVLDEVSSGVAFDDRWAALRAELLDDHDQAPSLLLAMAAGMALDDLRALAATFTDNWDLLSERILAGGPPPLPTVMVDDLISEARVLAEWQQRCTADDDRFLANLRALAVWTDRLADATDDPARLAVLRGAHDLKWSYGKAGNWPDLPAVKAACADFVARAAARVKAILDVVLRRLARHIATATLADARDRQGEGRLEFHDLLVLTRDLLRHPDHGAGVRHRLSQRYRRLMLDEFQDTDPIQIELAVRIAGGAAASAAAWSDVTVPEGSLFMVGDAKQSIYRFRRADIASYLNSQRKIGRTVALDTNFRTTAPVLDWINQVYGELIVADGVSQPEYHPQRAHRAGAPAGAPVTTLGVTAHQDAPTADELRTREAANVATAVRTALTDRWQVGDAKPTPDGTGWRDVRPRDIAVLVPARTCLPHLEAALDDIGVGYQVEASSLVYRTREIRDLLVAARAVDDPSDALALVTALRTPLFGCGDDDLLTWHQHGGRWNLLAPRPSAVDTDHPVARATAYLRTLHDERRWMAPGEVLSRLITDRRMMEVAATDTRHRDVWRRLRFVVDHARAWSEAQHGSLRDYLGWAARQGSETARAAESILPETDIDAVRIMTIHAAKGLEFPMVIVAGLSSRPGGARNAVTVLWPRDGGYEFKFRAQLQTADFDVAKPVDEQMDQHERLRLLYVACTRARDHLVVSLHRKDRADPGRANRTNAETLALATQLPSTLDISGPAPATGKLLDRHPVPAATPPPPYEAWNQTFIAVRAAAARPAAVAASHLEGSLPDTPRSAATNKLGEPEDPGLAKEARDLELPPWHKGRYGTAIGRAVHGVLQSVDLHSGHGLDDAVAAQTLAEGVTDHSDLVSQLAQAALDSDLIRRAADRPHWREFYTGTTIGDLVLEGIVDLLYRDEDGLVLVDYKTDAAPASALPARADYYRPQLAAYALAIAAATGEEVSRAMLLFLSPSGATALKVDDLAPARAQVHHAIDFRTSLRN